MKTLLPVILLLSVHFSQAQFIEADITQPLCFGDENGSIDITFNGGTPPYMYQWSNGSISEDLEFLSPSYYTVTITDFLDQNFVEGWDIIEPIEIFIDGNVQDPFCHSINGSLEGSIDVHALGGTEEFTYLWSGPGVDGTTDPSIFNIVGGIYQVTATDSNGCGAVGEFMITEPDEIIINADIQNLECIDGQSQFGSIEIMVEGGFPPYSFDWSGEVSDPFSVIQTDLGAGTYAVYVTDSNGCYVSQEFELVGAEPISISATINTIDCQDSETINGSIELTVDGGVPPYEYNWSGNVTDPTLQNQSNLDIGVYSVTVSDSEGCQFVEETVEMHANFIEPPSLCLITNDNPDGYNTVYWEDPEDLSDVDQYNIYREGSSVGQFDLIGSLEFGPENMFSDKEANSIQQAYRYYVTSANACGFESEPSAIHKTIHLTINQGSFGNMNLIWDEYDGLEYDQIVIYRGDSPSTLEEYVALPGNVFSYTDANALAGDAYYQIVITTSVECNTNHALYQLKSNVAGFFVNNVEDIDWLTAVYPNPFDDQITMVLESNAQAQIIDSKGRIVSEMILSEGFNKISMNNWSDGVYFVRLVSNREVGIWKGMKISQ